jgi:hypothetical protein
MSEAALTTDPDLDFEFIEAEADRHAAAPTVLLKMRATEHTGVRVHAGVLRCQIRIEPIRRSYNDTEAGRVVDIFGGRDRWGSTMQSMQLAFVTQLLPGFTGECAFDLQLPLSFDVHVAAHKYLAGLTEGHVPLVLMFSGTIFTGTAGQISVAHVPWHKETHVQLPVEVWQAAIDSHFAGQAWLRIHRDLYDRLGEYRSVHGLVGWDEAIGKLLDEGPS